MSHSVRLYNLWGHETNNETMLAGGINKLVPKTPTTNNCNACGCDWKGKVQYDVTTNPA